jgi:hypothetical protein
MASALFGLRVWMALITLVNLCIVISFYAWLVPFWNNRNQELELLSPFEYTWQDFALLIASPILFLAYLYSIWGKPRLHKFLRATLMLLPALFMLGINLRAIQMQVKAVNMLNENRRARGPDWDIPPLRPFDCGDTLEAACGIVQAYIFIPVIVGFFVIIEVFVTLFRGPLYPTKKIDF